MKRSNENENEKEYEEKVSNKMEAVRSRTGKGIE